MYNITMDSLEKLKLLKTITFTPNDAETVGVSAQNLVYLAKSGVIKRVETGLYSLPDYLPVGLTERLEELMKLMPQGIVGCETAVQQYGLSELPLEDICLVVSRSNRPSRVIKGVRFFQVGKNFDQIEVVEQGGIRLTSINQTIVDLLRTGKPMSYVHEIFIEAHGRGSFGQGNRISISKLKRIGKIFRASKKIEQLIDVVM